MSSSTKLLRQYIRTVKETQGTKKLWVFDFDDTLVKTDCVTHVTAADGTRFDLTPGQFAVYVKQPGESYDYSDFRNLVNPRAIKWMNRILHNVYAHHGAENIVILSARSFADPIHEFLQLMGLAGIEVVALDNSNPLAKARWVDDRIKRDGYNAVEFFDDSHKNVAAIRDLRQQHPEVEIVARHIVHTRIASLHA